MSALEPVQLERLREIGALLQHERESKGMSLEDVSAKTLIRPTILKAIEEGNAKPLPEPVYLRGFIRRYGDLMDLPGTQLSDSFPWEPSQVVPATFVASGVTTLESVDETRRPTSLPREDARVVEPDPVPPLSEPDSEIEPVPATEAELASDPTEQPTPPSIPPAAHSTPNLTTEEPATDSALQLTSEWVDLPEPTAPSITPSLEIDSQELAPDNLALPPRLPVIEDAQPNLSLGDSSAQTEAIAKADAPEISLSDSAELLTSGQVQDSALSPASGSVSEPASEPVVGPASDQLSSAKAWQSSQPADPVPPLTAPSEVEQTRVERPLPVEPRPMPKRPSVAQAAPDSSSGIPGSMVALILAAIVLGIGAAFALSNRGNEPAVVEQPADTASVESAEADVSTAPPAGETPSPIEDSTSTTDTSAPPETQAPESPAAVANSGTDSASSASTGSDEVSIQLDLKEPAWFYVEVDGLLVFEGVADEFTQEAKGKEIVIGTSRPDLLLVSVDGGQPKPMATEAADTIETYKPGG